MIGLSNLTFLLLNLTICVICLSILIPLSSFLLLKINKLLKKEENPSETNTEDFFQKFKRLFTIDLDDSNKITPIKKEEDDSKRKTSAPDESTEMEPEVREAEKIKEEKVDKIIYLDKQTLLNKNQDKLEPAEDE